jgi:hypothetical protein
MNYGEIVKAAFWITLRNRILWFFGFFAGGTSAGANFNTPQGTSAVSATRILEIRGEAVPGVRHPRRVSTLANGCSTTLP